MRIRAALFGLAASFCLGSAANAAEITFNATGQAGVSGYFTIDDSLLLGGVHDFYSNTIFTDFALNIFGEIFTLADVTTADQTIIDSSGAVPVIINGAGFLAQNGAFAIAFFPDDFNGSGADGDASLAFGTSFEDFEFFAVKWVVDAPSEVPLPAAFPLFVAGLASLGLTRRKRKTAA